MFSQPIIKCLCVGVNQIRVEPIASPFNYSILGMNLFGCKFCRKTAENTIHCDRKNFDSLLWALVTVFQVQLYAIGIKLLSKKHSFW